MAGGKYSGKWHINPKTHEVGQCNAKKQCRFENIVLGNNQHYNTKEEAEVIAKGRLIKDHGLLSKEKENQDSFKEKRNVQKYKTKNERDLTSLKKINFKFDRKQCEETRHVEFDRAARRLFIAEEIGEGEIRDTFSIDHNGENRYLIMLNTAVVEIYTTDEPPLFITTYAERPGRIKRYYTAANLEVPDDLIKISLDNIRKQDEYVRRSREKRRKRREKPYCEAPSQK